MIIIFHNLIKPDAKFEKNVRVPKTSQTPHNLPKKTMLIIYIYLYK